MYQWVNPGTGRTQMSGTPPAWYRAAPAGTPGKRTPRVLVFENGQLIDDTAIAVSEERRIQLRQQAFRGADVEARAAAAARPEAGTPPVSEATSAAVGSGGGDFSEPKPQATTTPAAPANSDETISRMKALIEQWDRQKTEQAKTLIQEQPAPAEAPAKSP